MMGDFHFLRPLFLLLIPVGLLTIYLLWSRASANSNWLDVCDPHLIKHLLVGRQLNNSGLPLIGMALGWTIASLAMAGPAWEKLPQPVHNLLKGRAIVFDLSQSMNSTDIRPSRLSLARYKLADLILAGSGLQQGLVVFAGDAFVVAPLTDDVDTLINLTPSLNTNTVPVQGSRADLGILLAASLIGNTGLSEGEIVLITDGVSPSTEDIAANVSSMGFRVSVLAVGTASGAPVPLDNGELLKDAEGNIVIPRVNHDSLRQVAMAGGGRYAEMSATNLDIEDLIRPGIKSLDLALNRSIIEGVGNDEFRSDQWRDNGPWLVLPLLLIVALGFRRGWILTLALLILPLTPLPSHAFSWDDLWNRADQQAAKYFRDEQYDQIQVDAPVEWQGAAKYRSGDFESAISAYSSSDTDNATAHYNQGNAMVRSGALQEAIGAYQRALDLNPNFEDAQFNKELVEKLLKQQNEQSDPSDQNAERSDDQQNSENSDQSSVQKFDQQGSQDSNQASNQKGSQRGPDDSLSQDNTAEGEDNLESNADNSDASEKKQRAGQTEPTQEDAGEDGALSEKLELPMSEQQQAMEQWLQRIPDDPGGLLRRKFAYQYSLRHQQTHEERW